jgi:hypothetical protein
MKTYFLPLAFLMFAFAGLLQAQINCINYPNRVATVSGYPTPRCTLLTPLFCNSAAMVHVDSVDFMSGHIYAPICAQFGLNPLADGRMALCFGRNVPNNMMSSFFTAPCGQVLVFELDLAKSPDMLYVWTYKDGLVTKLDSTPAIVGLLDLINGYARFFEFNFNSGDPGYPEDPNRNRMKFSIDGDERVNMVYDVVHQLWGGNPMVKIWISSIAGVLPINSQVATMFPTACATQIPLLKQQEQSNPIDDAAFTVEVFPNPSRDGSLNLTTNRTASFHVVSIVGSVIATGQIPIGTTSIATTAFAKGVYFVEFRNEGQVRHRRVVVE